MKFTKQVVESVILDACEIPTKGFKIEAKTFSYEYNNPTKEGVNIILSHPNGLNKETWIPFINALIEKNSSNDSLQIDSIVIFDLRNQGNSAEINKDLLENEMFWDTYSKDLLAVINQLNLNKKPLFAIGNSIGAYMSLQAESFSPGLFKKIVAIDPPAGLPFSEDLKNRFLSSRRRRGSWKTKELAIQYFKDKPFFQNWHPEVLQEYIDHGLRQSEKSQEVVLKCSPEQEFKTFTDDIGPKRADINFLRNVKCPVLLGAGTEFDVMLKDELLVSIANLLLNCKTIRIEGQGHLIPFENPNKTAQISLNFILSEEQDEVEMLKSKL